MGRNLAAIALGAGLGTIARYGVAVFISHLLKTEFPLATLVVNITGCFLLGGLITYLSHPPEVSLLLTTGCVGAYTTFSTFELDTARLLSSDRLLLGTIYWLVSDCLGLLSIALGVKIMEKLLPNV